MANEIAKTNNQPFFSLREGSNYKVMMTYDRSEVIEFEQFKRLMAQLNDTDIKFLTVNERIINKSTIIDISPTDEKTAKQREEMGKNPIDVLVEDESGKPVKLSELGT